MLESALLAAAANRIARGLSVGKKRVRGMGVGTALRARTDAGEAKLQAVVAGIESCGPGKRCEVAVRRVELHRFELRGAATGAEAGDHDHRQECEARDAQ